MKVSRTRSAKEVMLCWNAGTDQVIVVPWPDRCGRSDGYDMTALACDAYVAEMSPEQLKAVCFIEAMHLIVGDGCDPQAVHYALLGVTEYVDGCADDMPGVAPLRQQPEVDL